MIIKASKLCAKMHTHIGDKYVYGMTGHRYTINDARALELMYGAGHKCGDGYYATTENGKKNFYKGICPAYYGKWAADCSNFIMAVSREIGRPTGGMSANGIFVSCFQTGGMSTMPKKPGVFLFVNSGTVSAPHMGHVGTYVGGGMVIQAANAVKGIIHGRLSSNWTHWGLVSWIAYDVAADVEAVVDNTLDDAPDVAPQGNENDDVFDRDHVPYLRSGSKGTMVKYLELRLSKIGYKLPRSINRNGICDGIFGNEVNTAIKNLQARHGLVTDGIVGPLTWSVIQGYTCH
jgi:cell wall-associated NlpC family hydrolase